jgi:hypothetical protein
MENLPFERCYWVIPGRILAGAYPSSVDAEERQTILEGLLDVGIKTVINLTESGEVNHYGVELYDYSADFRASGLETVRKPIVDVDIPTFEEMDEILDLIEKCGHHNKRQPLTIRYDRVMAQPVSDDWDPSEVKKREELKVRMRVLQSLLAETFRPPPQPPTAES